MRSFANLYVMTSAALVLAITCIELVHEDPSYQPIYDAYGVLVLKLTEGTDRRHHEAG